MKRGMQIIIEVTHHAESFYEDAVQVGNHAAYALKGRHRSQMTGLENIAESALKFSDVLDYIKRQTARFQEWRQRFPQDTSNLGFGERLKRYIEKDLKEKRDMICDKQSIDIGNTTDEDLKWRRRVYMLLIRQFLRQVIVQYEYQVSLEKIEKEA